MKKVVSKEVQSLKHMIRELQVAYKQAKKKDSGWDDIYYAALSLFRELQQLERDALAHEKEFTRNIDSLVEIYMEARERAVASKFDAKR